MKPVYLTSDIRRIEEAPGTLPLMERAGAAAAELAAKLIAETSKDILVLAGPGNNGGDALIAAKDLQEKFFRVHVAKRPEELADRAWGLVIDGLFGIGLTRPVGGDYAKLVDYANKDPSPALPLLMPSGIQSDTGRVMGAAVHATHTITFIALKAG